MIARAISGGVKRARGIAGRASGSGTRTTIEQLGNVQSEHDVKRGESSTATALRQKSSEPIPYPISLPPPPAILYPTALPSLKQLILATQRYHLPKAIKHFSRLQQLQALDYLNPSDHESIARFLIQIIPTLDLSRFMRRPEGGAEDYGTLKEMAIHIAVVNLDPLAGKALHTFLQGLLKSSEPHQVINTFNAFKSRLRTHQGKSIEDLHSRIREERVGARLDHPDLLNLMTDHIAAHTMLDTFDGSEMLALLDTNANFRSPHAFNLRPLRRIFGFHPRGTLKGIIDRIRANCAKLCLAVLCYHPAALVNRIIGMIDARDWHGVEKLYQEVLVASIGPNRWLVPLDLEGRETGRYDCIPLTTQVWGTFTVIAKLTTATFMIAFRTSGRLDLIDQMIDTDMPARNLTPSAWNVSLAMISFAIAGSDKRNQQLNAGYLARADQLWERILDKGFTRFDIAIARRMDVLDMMRREHDWQQLYQACLNGHMSGGGRHTSATYIKLLLLRGRRIEALRVLKDMLSGGPKALCKPDAHTYYVILRHVVRGPYTPEEKLETVTALNEFSASFDSSSWAIILSLALENGQQVQDATRALVQLMHKRAPPEHGKLTITAWDHFLSALIRGSGGNPSVNELRAGLEALHEFSRRGATAKTSKTLINLHQLLLVNIARSHTMEADERHHALVATFALLKRQEPDPHRRVYAAVLRVCLEREDDEGYDEALYWWALLKERSDVADSAWTTMLQGLLTAGRHSAAQALVEEARFSIGKAGQDSKRFWDLAVAVERDGEVSIGYEEVLEDVTDEAVKPVLEWKGVEAEELEEEWEDQAD